MHAMQVSKYPVHAVTHGVFGAAAATGNYSYRPTPAQVIDTQT